jgi:tetratricopeptide (TPR) repeat protein
LPRTANHIGRLFALILTLTLSMPAFAQVPTQVSVERNGSAARILLSYDEELVQSDPTVDVSVEHTVLIADLSEPVQADVSNLIEQIPDIAARARLDPDGSTLRIALRGNTETSVSTSYNVVAIDLLPPGSSAFDPVISPREQREIDAAALAAEIAARGPVAPPPADPLPVQLRVGQTTEYSRIELTWPRAVEHSLSQTGTLAEVRFAEPADISLGSMAGSPPRFLERVTSERIGDEWVLRLELSPGVQARSWSEDGLVVIDLPDPDAANAAAILTQLADMTPNEVDEEVSPEPVVDAAEEAAAVIEPPADIAGAVPAEADQPVVADEASEPDTVTLAAGDVDPVPENGVVHATAAEASGDLWVVFNWEAPVGAAVFRRGEAIWVVFDASAALELEELAFSQRGHVRSFQAVQGDGYSAARIVAPASTQAEARADGNSWTIVLSERIDSPPRPISVRRDARRGRPGRLIVGLESARSVRWVEDPAVGDRIGVVTAGVPVQGLTSRRDFIGGSLLLSAHGGALEALADDLSIELISGGAAISREGGLDLTPASIALTGSSDAVLLANISSPAFMDFEGWKGEGRFLDEWRARQQRAALEDGPDGRIALARFLLGHGLAPEAVGILDLAIEIEPQLATDAHVRSLQGVANYFMSRPDTAIEYLADPSLVLDPAADLWRGMAALDQERWVEARRRLESGDAATYHYSPVWRARFRAANARAALEVGDHPATQAHLYAIDNDEPDMRTRLDAAYISARLAAATGDLSTALERLEALSHSGVGVLEARSIYDLNRLRLEAGQISRAEAIDNLENLRYRWRGDTIELDTVRTLGELYVADGAFAQGLETMMTAQARFPNTEAARRIGEEMVVTFRRLFLDGEADRMDPIQAVALFYQYEELTPVDSDGDRMIRRLADRLIAFDLLDPAAALLQHQVDCHRDQRSSDCRYRLREPAARARVAADLAVVYLMDRRYEEARNVLRNTRVANLPEDLVRERYLLESRSLVELGRHEQALALVDNNRSPAADRLRADIAWDQQDWPVTGRRLETILANRWTQREPLTQAEQSDLTRAAIAYSLAGDLEGAQRLGERYGEAMATTEQAAAFEILTADDVTPGDVRFSDIAGRIASIDTLDAFLEPFRARFNRDPGGPS